MAEPQFLRGEMLYERLLMPVLREVMEDTRVVCVLGPRQCGKTTLVCQFDPGRPFLDLDAASYRQVAAADPGGFVAGLPDPVTIDEVQRVPPCCLPSRWPWTGTRDRAGSS